MIVPDLVKAVEQGKRKHTMNQRIKLLAEQATRKYDRLGNEILFAQPDLEKFAELIVAECVQSIEKTIATN